MPGETIANPVTLGYALTSKNLVSGDILYLRGGTYKGRYLLNSNCAGITIRPYQNEKPIIDGYLDVQASDVTIIELEIMSSATQRVWDNTTGDPTLNSDGGVRSMAAGTKIINCIIHDTPCDGLGLWQTGLNTIAYGNLIYNNGYEGSDRLHGHGIYTQNITGTKTYKHNILGKNFYFCFQAYARTDTPQKGFDFLSNVCVNGSSLFGGDSSVRYEDIKANGNHFLGACIFGHLYQQNGDVEFLNNRLHSTTPPDSGFSTMPLYFEWFETINAQNNVVSVAGDSFMRFYQPDDIQYNNQVIDNNLYFGDSATGKMFVDTTYNLAEWQALGFDLNSTQSTDMPTTNVVEVFANEYKDELSQRMGSFVIWNWEDLEAISVDLSSLELTIGESYRWRQAQDPYVDTDTFEYTGDPVSFSMLAHTVAEPIGYGSALTTTSFPLLGAFVVEKA